MKLLRNFIIFCFILFSWTVSANASLYYDIIPEYDYYNHPIGDLRHYDVTELTSLDTGEKNYGFSSYFSYQAKSWEDTYWNNHNVKRAFIEVDLTEWYNLGISPDDITQVVLSADSVNYSNAAINVFDMTNELFSAGCNAASFNAPYDPAALGSYVVNDYYPLFSADVTSALRKDAQNNKQYSGVLIKLQDESLPPQGTYHQTASFYPKSTMMRINYEKSVVPEPSSMLLLGAGLLGLLGFRKKKKV